MTWWDTVEDLVPTGPDGIRRPIGNRPMRVFIPFGGVKRHVRQDGIQGVRKRVANPLQVANLPYKRRCAHDV
jgi:hypothetical protein